jgi:pyrimidine-nucleoside phosphorylase
MDVYELIKKKRDGQRLTRSEIGFLVEGFTRGEIPDYQMAAMLMAIYFNGMAPQESLDLTMTMVNSGERVDLSMIEGFKVDKHSTGGVGDTTTLVLAPLVAASGGVVAKMTGRELGHTGGTIDKLESIPGFQAELSKARYIEIVNRNRLAIIAQTASLAPADKRLYALRNVTATVDSIPLIAGSIMSKKLAAGSDGIVLDVKTGTGAFMRRYEDALELAQMMVTIGEEAGKRVVALITGMEQPLGFAVGNAMEVIEAIETLKGRGPDDLVELVTQIGGDMLAISNLVATREAGQAKIAENIANGRGLNKLQELIRAQGGDARVIEDYALLPQSKDKIPVKAESSGFLARIDALKVGLASKVLGAGRQVKEDPVDYSVGIRLAKKAGDRVKRGDVLAVLHANGDQRRVESARTRFLDAVTIESNPVQPPRLFHARVSRAGVQDLAKK